LLSLERTYADFLKRYQSPSITKLESAGAIYEPHRYVVGTTRPNVAFRLVNANGDTVSVRHQLIAPLVGMIRALANRQHVVASLGQDIIDREIKGHPKESTGERVSILPLPTIRQGPTDGRIRRVMLAQPQESDGALCNWLGQLFDGQGLTPLSDEERFPSLFLERISRFDTVLPYYTGVSRVWASVTAVLLPGYDDRKDHRGNHQKRLARAEQLVRKALRQANINVPSHVELSRVPYWTGSLHARDYRPREKLAHYPCWHVRLTFDRPWTGPLLIGAGRHCGFGVFARVDGME
jgi:CRISPR-associated protein Csb2